MPKRFQCQSKKVIKIAEQQVGSDLFLVIDFILNDTNVNLNGVQYSEDFLTEIGENSEKYQGLPLKVDYNKLVSGNVSNLTHNLVNNKFYNQMIGSFTKFYTQRNDQGVLELAGTVRIPKEFLDACEVIQQLYDDDALFVSYEIIVGKSTTKNNGEITYVDKDESNYLEGYSIVSTPAVVSAKAVFLVAEIMNNNSNNAKEGGEKQVAKKKWKDMTEKEFVAEIKEIDKTKNIKNKQIAELSYDQVMTNLYNQLKEALGSDYWDFYAEDHGVNFLIMESYDDGSLVRVDFTVDGDTVVITDCYPVTKSYPAITQTQTASTRNNKKKGNDSMTIEEANAKIAQKDAELKVKEAEIASIKKENEAKDKDIKVKETEIAEQKTNVEKLSASVLGKDKTIKEFESVKTELASLKKEKADKVLAEKSKTLKDKYSKLLPAEVMEKKEIKDAIEKADESILSAEVVKAALETAEKKTKVETASKRIIDPMEMNGDPISEYVSVGRTF